MGPIREKLGDDLSRLIMGWAPQSFRRNAGNTAKLVIFSEIGHILPHELESAKGKVPDPFHKAVQKSRCYARDEDEAGLEKSPPAHRRWRPKQRRLREEGTRLIILSDQDVDHGRHCGFRCCWPSAAVHNQADSEW